MADLTIAGATNAAALTGAEEMPGLQGGTDVAISVAQILAYLKGQGMPVAVARSGVAVQLTGTTTETTLATIVIPGGAIGPNGQVEVEYLVSYGAANANSKQTKVKFGGTTYSGFNSTAAALSAQARIRIANRNSASSQVGQPAHQTLSGFGGSASAVATSAVDTSADVTILITGTLAVNTDTMTLESYLVRVAYGA
ncbi:MAG TPA: hypothetical protein VF589_03645 [Allosphingosinicella sp.]|jgi:hypothetical protein